MSVSFLAAGVATAVAAVITAMLVVRFARLPRPDQAAWACAAAGLTLALAAQALGYHRGFNAAAFRAIEVGARLAAPMALVWGLAELTGKSFGVRFGSRLGLAALTAIAGVVLASDPLSGVTFTVAWPTAADHYQFIPNVVLVAIAAATVIPALIAPALVAVRARREPGWREVFPAVAAAAGAALLTLGLQVKLPVNSGYAAICLIAAVLTWFAGQWSRRVRLADLHESAAAGDDTGWGEAYTDTGYGLYRPDTGAMRRVGSDTGFGGLYRPGTGGFGGSAAIPISAACTGRRIPAGSGRSAATAPSGTSAATPATASTGPIPTSGRSSPTARTTRTATRCPGSSRRVTSCRCRSTSSRPPRAGRVARPRRRPHAFTGR